MPNFGYVGKHASQSRTANTGVFDTDEINYLLQEAEWKLQDLAGEYIVVAGGGGGGGGRHAASHYRGGGGGGAVHHHLR